MKHIIINDTKVTHVLYIHILCMCVIVWYKRIFNN